MRASCRDLASLLFSVLILSGFSGADELLPLSPVLSLPDSLQAELIRSLIDEGSHERAHALAELRLAAVEEETGPASVETAHALDLFVSAKQGRGDKASDETIDLARRSLRILKDRLGSQNSDVADALRSLAAIHRARDEYPEARSLLEESLAIMEEATDSDDPRVASILYSLGSLLKRLNDYDGAIGPIKRALAIREKAYGPDHPEVGLSLNQLANFESETGEYQHARLLYERVVAIFEKEKGPDHPHVAGMNYNLANQLYLLGEYSEAEPRFDRALAIFEKRLGADHPNVALVLNGSAGLLRARGDYVGARGRYERAVGIYEKSYGSESARVATSLDNLGLMAADMGDQERAKEYFERSLGIKTEVFGLRHEEIAITLNGLARVHQESGDLEGAVEIFQQARGIREEIFGDSHPLLGSTLINLAILAELKGDRALSGDYYRHALRIFEILGENHPKVPACLEGLARWERGERDLDRAIDLYRRSLRICETAFGPGHPRVAIVHEGLAQCYWSKGNRRAAISEALREEEISREHLRLTARFLPESQALSYASHLSRGLPYLLTFLEEERTSEEAGVVWDAVIRSRALVFDEMAERRRTVTASGIPEVRRQSASLMRASTRLANLVVRGPGGEGVDAYRGLLAGAREERDRAERRLAETSEPFRDALTINNVGYDDVRKALRRNEVLISFVRGEGAGTGRDIPEASYFAFIQKGDQTEPVAYRLGPVSLIEFETSLWRTEVGRGVEVSGSDASERERACRIAGEELRRMVWDPFAADLGDADRIYIVPDGALLRINFGALPTPEGYLIEETPVLHTLSSERDLVGISRSESNSSGMLVFGDPDYDVRIKEGSDSDLDNSGTDGIENSVALLSIRSARTKGCSEYRELRFPPLPSSRIEAEKIASLWKDRRDSDGENAQIQMGRAATEALFKQEAPGRRYLHLATHAFFLGDECAGSAISPLLLSGLVFAGANDREDLTLDAEDGLLTAEEIVRLNLEGVEWAVLSGCETGDGVVRAGEGVFGLRRAFEIAGAQSLIMSLWRVEDEWCNRWMDRLYTLHRKDGLESAAAVRSAGLAILNERRSQGLSTHPFYWGSFISVGRN